MQFKLKRLLHDPQMAEGKDQSTLATGVFFKIYSTQTPDHPYLVYLPTFDGFVR